jgi:hypothetical protein
MPYTMPIPTRAQWQAIRDGAHVPKGAAKVSVGDSIEKVHKSFKPDTISANLKDTETLITNLDSYINATKVKYPAFEAVVKDKVRKKVVNHQAFLKDIVKAKTEYYPRYNEATEMYKKVKNGGAEKPKDLARKLERLKGCVDAFALIDPNWEAKRPKLQSVFQICDSVATLSDTNKTSIENIFVELKP